MKMMTDKTGDYILFYYFKDNIELDTFFIDKMVDVGSLFEAKLINRGLINLDDVNFSTSDSLYFNSVLFFNGSDIDQIMSEIHGELKLKEIRVECFFAHSQTLKEYFEPWMAQVT